MLDMGFIPAIRRILALLPDKRQNLLFSATFPDEIRKLANSFMRDPATVEVAPRNKPIELISQVVHPVHQTRKRELLSHLVKTNNWQQVLVFTRTKHGANRLAQSLERDGIDADAIHGNKTQGARTRALKRFKSNELQVLVATDIASRGLDIEELPHVVNYDLPHVPEDYLHRIGRTGRAGATGEAVSLVSGEDRPLLAAIERLTNRRIEQKIVAGFEPSTTSHAPVQRHEPQRHHRGQQNGGQSRHRNSNASSGSRREQDNRQGARNAPQAPRKGPQQRHRHGEKRPAQHLSQSRQPHVDQRDDQQPAPERAGNQPFPGLLGGLTRRIFGR
jgi:ATP-dependent RNA helicase RhlE